MELRMGKIVKGFRDKDLATDFVRLKGRYKKTRIFGAFARDRCDWVVSIFFCIVWSIESGTSMHELQGALELKISFIK